MTPSGHDLSLLGLFLAADPVVKGIMLLLVVASVAVWAIAFDRLVRLSRLRREADALAVAARGGTAGRAPHGLAAAVLQAGRDAALPEAAEPGEGPDGRRERLREGMRLAVAESLRPAERGLPWLATVGSAAPFIGLFGTVWGIMNSFSSIAASNDTSLAVVAPGIAEALFATAIGLVAAIPAVVLYNRLVTGLGSVRASASASVLRLSRRLAAGSAPAQRLAAE